MKYSDIGENTPITSILKRDDKHIKSLLSETKDGRLIALKDIDIVFPEDYLTAKLAKMDEKFQLLGVFAFVDLEAKKYAVFSIPARVYANISEMFTFKNQDEVQRVLHYTRGDTILETMDVMAEEQLSYYIYHHFTALGRVPWFMNYDDILKIYDKDSYYIGKSLINIPQVLEMIQSNIARDPKNDKFMYRDTVKNYDEVDSKMPNWVALRNISLGATDTYNKLLGSYYEDGLTSGLAEKSKKITRIEKILRS